MPSETLMFHLLEIAAIAIFLIGCWRRLSFWSDGRPLILIRKIPGIMLGRRGLRYRISDGIFQLRLLRQAGPLRWIMSLSLAIGFVVLFFIGSLGDMLIAFGWVSFTKDTPWFAAINDFGGLLLAIGIILAVYRRYILRDPYLWTTKEDGLILLWLALIVYSGYKLEVVRLLAERVPPDTAWFSFIAYPLSRLSSTLNFQWDYWYPIAWWSHAVISLSLVAYLPYSELLHIFAAPLTISLTSRGDSPVTAARQFWKVELDACTQCGECLRVCDSYGVVRDQRVAVKGMFKERRRSSDGQTAVSGQRSAVSSFTDSYIGGVYSCTLCARCAQVCPVRIETREMVLALRDEIVSAGKGAHNLNLVKDNQDKEHNVFGYPNEERLLWAEFLDELPPDLLDKDRARVLYYVGCVSSFSPAISEIPQAFLRLLLRAGVDVALLGKDEWCCGFPMIVAGMPKEAEAMREHNLAELHRLGVETVVFNCPSCYHTWHHYYRPEGVELLHSTEFIARLVKTGKLHFKPLSEKITYHDPCDLGRGMGIYDPPREIITAIPGAELVELSQNRETGFCCGGGGDVEILDRQLVGSINAHLVGEIEQTGASMVVEACPQCRRTTQEGIRAKGVSITSLDIVELADRHGIFE